MPASEVMERIISEPATAKQITPADPKPATVTSTTNGGPSAQPMLPSLPLPGEDYLLRKTKTADIRERTPIYQRRRALPFNPLSSAKSNDQLRGARPADDEFQRLEKELVELWKKYL